MKKVLVDDWIVYNRGGVYKVDRNKDVVVRFDKILNVTKNNSVNKFFIPKESYKNRIEKIAGYSNYFFKYYDPDKYILNKIGIIKALVDNKSKRVKKKYFMSLLLDYVFTLDCRMAIEKMVDDNYLYILDKNKDSVLTKHFELIINDRYGKRIMCAVVAINIVYPLIVHYVTIYNKKDADLYEYFVPLLDMFSDETIDIHEKLALFVWTNVQISAKRDKKSWRQRLQLGDMGKDEFYDICFRKHIITDSLPSLIFDNHMGAYFKRVIDRQIGFYIGAEFDYMPIELDNDKRGDMSISSMDRFEMSLNRQDESIIILADNNIQNVIATIKERYNLETYEEELEYYINNLELDSVQVQLINYFYARYFNGFRDLKLIKKSDHIELTLLLKRRLQAQGMIYLPYILTGNFKYKGKSNKILTKKIIKEIKLSTDYQEMIKSKFEYIVKLKGKDPIIGLLQSILNSTYKYVDYDNKDRTGKDIDYDIDVFIYEFLSFINQI